RFPFAASAALAIGSMAVLALLGVLRRPDDVRRRVRWIAYGAAGVIAIGLIGLLIAGAAARNEFSRGDQLSRRGLNQLGQGDLSGAAISLREAAGAFHRAGDQLDAWFAQPARLLPAAAQHRDVPAAVAADAGDALAEMADVLATIDLEQLQVVQGRVDIAAVRELAAPFARLQQSLDALDASLDRPGSQWLVGPVQERLARAHRQVAERAVQLDNAVTAVRLAPAMLGEGGVRRYFVAFVTPAEARGLIGFMGNWAELTITDGLIEMSIFGSEDDLNMGGADPEGRVMGGPADFLRVYGGFGFVEADGTTGVVPWKNITLPPDLPLVAGAISDLYPKSGGQPIDGVFVLDPSAIAALMEITGPIQLAELQRPLTADNTQAFIERGQYELPQQERLDLIDVVAQTTVRELLSGSMPSPPTLGRIFGPVIADRGLMAWSANPEEQEFFTALRMDGSFGTLAGDDEVYVAVNNAGANKIDAYARRTITVDDTGAIIVLSNDAPPSGLADYVIGNQDALPWGTNWARYTIYSSRVIVEFTLDGEPLAVSNNEEFGRHAYTVYLAVPPESELTLTLTFAPD
ncbi:MAG: DUF4012 domain-containing protein, partial [Ilumatobacteraceae bacterium]